MVLVIVSRNSSDHRKFGVKKVDFESFCLTYFSLEEPFIHLFDNMKLQLAPSLLLITAASTFGAASAQNLNKKERQRLRLLNPNQQVPNKNGHKKGHVFKPVEEGKVVKGHPDAPGRIKKSYLVELKGFDVSETSNSYRHLQEEQCNFDIFKAEVEAKCANSVQPREGEQGVCDYTFKGNPPNAARH